MSSWVLKDAIADQFAWPILGKFFEHTVYTPEQVQEHDSLGWTVFLQQLWGKQNWTADNFYDPNFTEGETTVKTLNNAAQLVIEVSQELFDISVLNSFRTPVNIPEIDVLLTVGGVAISNISLPVSENLMTAQALRVALTLESGFELCRVCVREALVGQSLKDSTPLRLRLAKLAQNQVSQGYIYPQSSLSSSELWSRQSVILGRQLGTINSSVSRRVIFPKTLAPELIRMAQVSQIPLMQIPPVGESVTQIIYAPDVIGNTQFLSSTAVNIIANRAKNFYTREHFESLFSSKADPWKYTSSYEQVKYEQTLSLVPKKPIKKALELACAEGHFTVQLAPLVDDLLAADISQVALDRTAERCASFEHIHYQQMDLIKDPLPGQFDLIVCSEVLYYVGSLESLQTVAQKIADALEPGGYFLTAHAHQIIDEPDKPGFDWGLPFGAKTIGETFASIPSLYLAKAIQTPLYRVQLFRRYPSIRLPWQQFKPEMTILEKQPTDLPPQVEARVKWQGGEPSQWGQLETIVTAKLPILMYHRVAPSGSEKMATYRVTPEAFEEQLRYLKDASFYSVSWEQWQLAQWQRRPLPGRGVIITFDDGYLDFFEYAWPLLKSMGLVRLSF